VLLLSLVAAYGTVSYGGGADLAKHRRIRKEGEANEYRLWAGGIGNRLQISMQASPATSRALASSLEIVLPSWPLPRS